LPSSSWISPHASSDAEARLWSADTFVDFEHGLNAAVKRLRDTLGDAADRPRFVETVPKRGYRFVAPVDGLGSPVGIKPSAPATIRRWLFAAAALAIIAAGLASWRLLQATSAPESLS
jgi:hypothetical protein